MDDCDIIEKDIQKNFKLGHCDVHSVMLRDDEFVGVVTMVDNFDDEHDDGDRRTDDERHDHGRLGLKHYGFLCRQRTTSCQHTSSCEARLEIVVAEAWTVTMTMITRPVSSLYTQL